MDYHRQAVPLRIKPYSIKGFVDNYTTCDLLDYSFKYIHDCREIGRDCAGAGDLPEELVTFSARFPIDFHPGSFPGKKLQVPNCH